jgi:hypothetical protein
MSLSSNTRIWTPEFIMPGPVSREAKRGMELVDLLQLGFLPGVAGGANRLGTHVAGDVVTQTADGRDLNDVWLTFQDLLNEVNAQRQALIRFLTFPVTNSTDQVTQPGSGVDFEEASEFGEPVGSRIQPAYFNLGYTFKWYDLAARYTWQYLADATTAMVNSVANAAVEAYFRKLLTEVFRTIFNATNLTATIQGTAYNVYKFYNNDGTVPPTYKGNTFLGTHQHYKTTGATTVDPVDLDTLVIDDFASHGYSQENGYRLVLMAHTNVANTIRGFRAGTASARYDFIPAQGQPGQITVLNQQIVGQSQVAPTLDGLTVIGNYGPLLIVAEDYIPTTHMFAFATGGSESLNNPIGIREHAQTNLRGLRLVKGRNADYPLIDSFWAAGFGTGVRQRGGGIVLELTADATYDPPAAYV